MPYTNVDGTTIITGDSIMDYRNRTILSMLKLEGEGIKFKRSILAAIKRQEGFKGSRMSVIQQFKERKGL